MAARPTKRSVAAWRSKRSLKKKVDRIIRVQNKIAPECKVLSASVNLTPLVQGLNVNYGIPTQGSTNSTRVGSRIRVLGFEVNGLMVNTHATATSYYTRFFAIDRSVNGVIPTFTQLMQTSTAGHAWMSSFNTDTVSGRLCPYEGGNKRKRFKISNFKRDYVTPTTTWTPKTAYPFTMRKKCNFEINYIANNGLPADILDKQIYLCFNASDANTSTQYHISLFSLIHNNIVKLFSKVIVYT